jgi:lysozyme
VPVINAAGLALIESFEGLSLTAYPDPGTGGDPWTIGYGHTGPDVHKGLTITKEYAQVLLAKDCVTAEKRVASLIQITLTPNQFSALVSFEFNTGALGSSPALALINQHQGADAWENHLCLYVHGGNGEVLEGLVRRRAAEYALWNTH